MDQCLPRGAAFSGVPDSCSLLYFNSLDISVRYRKDMPVIFAVNICKLECVEVFRELELLIEAIFQVFEM